MVARVNMKVFVLITILFTLTTGCPDLWTSLNGRCYKTSSEAMDWYAAQQYCVNEGGYLVEIESEDEQASLFAVLSEELNYWIGLADFASEGTWVWQHSFNPATYFFWASGEPNDDDGSEDCVHLDVTKGWAWNDNDCDRSSDALIHALCETEDSF